MKVDDNEFPKLILEEVADDGSATDTPAADHRALFLGEDGTLRLKDSAAAVTDVGGGGGGVTTAPYLVGAADAGLSAEIVRAELADNVTGSPVSMAGASLGTGVTVGTAGGLVLITFTNAAEQQWDVASAIGTGDFDARARVVNLIPSVASVSFSPFLELVLSDTGRTASTALMMQMYGKGSLATTINLAQGVINGSVQGKPIMGAIAPLVLRISRVGTAVSFWVSTDNGLAWAKSGTATSALSIGKIGLWVCANTHTEAQCLVEYIRA